MFQCGNHSRLFSLYLRVYRHLAPWSSVLTQFFCDEGVRSGFLRAYFFRFLKKDSCKVLIVLFVNALPPGSTKMLEL